jgi:probable Rubsico expression protein CbbX
MAGDGTTQRPVSEAPAAMATEGQGWSGGEGVAIAPPLGPGARRDASRRFGRGGIDERFAEAADPLRNVPDHTEVDPRAALADANVEEILAGLDRDLFSLGTVKQRIREIASLLVIDRLRRSIGLESDPPTLHMCFTGNPGTGKTTVAKRMGEILFRLGFARKGHLVSASRDDLVGQYVGHTAPKTREVIKRAMGGVLFIDEAYHIYRVDNERDYGQETVEILLEVMENRREDLVVIMAGYKPAMNRFFSDVPGLSSRIAHHIDFPDYSAEELTEIARRMLEQQRYRFTVEAERAFEEYLERRMEQPRFANGRSARNGLDRVRMRHAIRLYEAASRGRRLTKRDLVTIEAEDVRNSRVFQAGSWSGAEA